MKKALIIMTIATSFLCAAAEIKPRADIVSVVCYNVFLPHEVGKIDIVSGERYIDEEEIVCDEIYSDGSNWFTMDSLFVERDSKDNDLSYRDKVNREIAKQSFDQRKKIRSGITLKIPEKPVKQPRVGCRCCVSDKKNRSGYSYVALDCRFFDNSYKTLFYPPTL